MGIQKKYGLPLKMKKRNFVYSHFFINKQYMIFLFITVSYLIRVKVPLRKRYFIINNDSVLKECR